MMAALCDLAEQDGVKVRLLCVPDEESEDIDSTVHRLRRGGLRRRIRVCGEPTDLHIGVQAKGVLAFAIHV